ncbi:MBL fold metallo-hydrolase [Phenylobacterium sp.]|uniref:MBL fold metallo-hydrolase n=1 Tax=Phenylobacterium sp. TaxID=1871053 RepID=UPI0035B2D0F1
MIPFVRDFQFEYGRCDQVSPLIRRVVADNPGPFTFTGTGTYIVGQGQVAVIDPGPDDPAHLEAILRAVDGETVSHILITHHHVDHSPLAGALKAATGAPIYGCPVASRPDAADSAIRTEAGSDVDFQPDVSVCEGATIQGRGWTMEAIPTPGHTSNHICYALAEENALFSGDHIMGWSTTVITPPDGDMAAYFASLDKVRARGFARLWPTHGPPVDDVDGFIGAYIAHRRAREAQVLKAVGEGLATIGQMVPVLYAEVDPRLHPAASRSVLAHLIDLTQRGVVTAEGGAGPDSVYRLAG